MFSTSAKESVTEFVEKTVKPGPGPAKTTA